MEILCIKREGESEKHRLKGVERNRARARAGAGASKSKRTQLRETVGLGDEGGTACLLLHPAHPTSIHTRLLVMVCRVRATLLEAAGTWLDVRTDCPNIRTDRTQLLLRILFVLLLGLLLLLVLLLVQLMPLLLLLLRGELLIQSLGHLHCLVAADRMMRSNWDRFGFHLFATQLEAIETERGARTLVRQQGTLGETQRERESMKERERERD